MVAGASIDRTYPEADRKQQGPPSFTPAGVSVGLLVDRQPESSPELEMGSIFIQVQRFVDETANEAECKAQEVISAAESQAADTLQRAAEAERNAQAMVDSARVEAAGITERARQQASLVPSQAHPPIPPEAVADLSAAIEEFANTNRILVAELGQLLQALTESCEAAPEPRYSHPYPVPVIANRSNSAALRPTSE
jgi:vacuolar-type H+-ATPase subunit H